MSTPNDYKFEDRKPYDTVGREDTIRTVQGGVAEVIMDINSGRATLDPEKVGKLQAAAHDLAANANLNLIRVRPVEEQ